MSPVTIYTTRFCPYCVSAKELLRKKNVTFSEIDVTGNPTARKAMSDAAGGRTTVPQIFIAERHVGGCDDLYDLDHAGQLDPLLLQAS
ncbi:glutaredoxin 3 [Lichenihabitans sp. PAMC28606]|uniref:glutaredoxin 3 n=1 Tax=Lichenihabitans sp. PAMC28606 TaxID=2880932 RepID=UPI001D0A9980|nr:glutaredoxin 3 [Lichenihabitans sp. PAMC28606]UDL94775.1 glutaredoxin 3 [Lichenihabitans sp. PAMC28606]